MDEGVQEVVEYMEDLIQDENVPKNIKIKITDIIKNLKSASEENLSLRVNKILSDLDDIANDANLDQFTRQQVWSITGMLEGI